MHWASIQAKILHTSLRHQNIDNRTKTALVGWYFRKQDEGVMVNINDYKWEIMKNFQIPTRWKEMRSVFNRKIADNEKQRPKKPKQEIWTHELVQAPLEV